jgi:spermidine synthase
MYKPRMRAARAILVGVALVCFANLLLEVMITRIFSATMFYHFTFVALGLAMFGIAASGVFVFVHEEVLASNVEAHLARYARRFALATIFALIYTLANPIFAGGQVPVFSSRVVWQMVLLVVFTALPFFFAGVVVSLAMTFYRTNVNRVYFFDLAGAAFAAVTGSLVLRLFGAPTAELIAASAALTAAALFEPRRRRWMWPAVAAVGALLNVAVPLVRVGSVKWEGRIQFEKWNAFSRVTVDTGRRIKIDASAETLVSDKRKLTPELYKPEISALALSMFDADPDHVLIIGPGGGRDVLFALSRGAHRITGVEINPIIGNDVMRDRYAEASGRLYFDDRVEIVIDEGRSYVRHSDLRYDMIQASLVDTWAATVAGAYALTENTLYTLEAFREYYEHLTDRGAVTMTRFSDDNFAGINVSAESPRLILLASGALESLGVPAIQTRRHLFFAVNRVQRLGTLVAKRTEITPDELARLEAAAAKAKFEVALSPTTSGQSLLERYVDAGAWSDVVTSARDELTPPTDDRPFFFYFKKFSDLFHPEWRIYDPALWMIVSLGSIFALAIAFIVMPLVFRLIRSGLPSRDESLGLQCATLGYFGLVGFSFMAIEIALMQRFSLFLGHPSYSLLVILSVVLLATAVGAYLSGRFALARLSQVILAGGLGIAALATLYGIVLGDLLRAWIGLGIPIRIGLTILLATPCGLLMGAMIPSAVRILGAANSTLIPWGWGVNGATSVIGTSLATVIAIYAGFTTTFLVGAVGYAAAAVLGQRLAIVYRGRSSTG